MTFLYLLGIRIFQLLVNVASLFNPKAKLWLKGRKNIFTKISNSIHVDDKIVWFHCASLGEFEQGRPVIELFKEKFPEYKILLTFYSPSGYEIRKNYECADFVFYLPIDTPGNAKKFLNITNPQYVFFIKYEFWYFLLREISRRNIPLYLVSGIFRKNQRFFKKRAINSRKMLSWFTHFFVQNEESKQLLNSIKLNNVSVTGDTRFDRVYAIAQNAKKLSLIEKFKNNSLVLVAGSSWKPDEEILLKWFNKNQFKLKLIIAPHEIHQENISRLLSFIHPSISVLEYSKANDENIQQAQVLIIDSIGLLSSIYKYGDIAYIGGGFGKGIHNILEAATFGMPIIFGPNYNKFKEATDLIQLKSAFPVSSLSTFKEHIDSLLENPLLIKEKGKISTNYVKQKCGATAKIIQFINF